MASIVAVVAGLVLYPIYYLLQASLDVGLPDSRPPTAYGTANFAKLFDYPHIIWNTLVVTFTSTVMALLFGFVTAWILTRTNVPFKRTLDQLMTVPYYVTPLLGALAWSFLGAPESGFINQYWRWLGGTGPLIDITSPMGIAWVMALFEGSVAYVMISAVMQSMDPALEEASQVMGATRWRTMWRVTLPLVTPGVLGAAIFVFAEMLGSFSVALVLGTPARFYVITTAIYHFVSQYPPRIPLAAAMGVSLFAVMFAMLWLYRWLTSRKSYVTVSGKAFRPRVMDMGRLRWALFGIVALYVFLSAILPIATLFFSSFQRLAVAFPAASNFTLVNFSQAFSINAVRTAMLNSVILGVVTATLGIVITGLLTWIILRSRLPGRGMLEYLVMFWVLLIAYLTVFMPLGVRTISGVVLQLDKSLDECGQVCGASWAYRIRTITAPLLRPGLLAAWLLIFVASVRELGASILLMGPDSKVMTPAIVEAWFSSSSELTAAMALIQTVVITLAILVFSLFTRRLAMHGASAQ